MPLQESIDLVDQLADSAPAMAIGVGGVLFIAKLFLSSYAKSEEKRAQIMDERHKTYFAQLDSMNQATVQAMDRGTKALQEATAAQRESNLVLGGVQELMRDLKRERAA